MATARPIHRTETMIALKAARTAIKVARDVGNPPVDLEHWYCGVCETELDWRDSLAADFVVPCPACGTLNTLPSYLRRLLKPPLTSQLPAQPVQPFVWRRPTLRQVLATLFALACIAVLIATALRAPYRW